MSELLELAAAIAREAGGVARARFHDPRTIRTKTTRDRPGHRRRPRARSLDPRAHPRGAPARRAADRGEPRLGRLERRALDRRSARRHRRTTRTHSRTSRSRSGSRSTASALRRRGLRSDARRAVQRREGPRQSLERQADPRVRHVRAPPRAARDGLRLRRAPEAHSEPRALRALRGLRAGDPARGLGCARLRLRRVRPLRRLLGAAPARRGTWRRGCCSSRKRAAESATSTRALPRRRGRASWRATGACTTPCSPCSRALSSAASLGAAAGGAAAGAGADFTNWFLNDSGLSGT